MGDGEPGDLGLIVIVTQSGKPDRGNATILLLKMEEDARDQVQNQSNVQVFYVLKTFYNFMVNKF